MKFTLLRLILNLQVTGRILLIFPRSLKLTLTLFPAISRLMIAFTGQDMKADVFLARKSPGT